MKKNVALCVTKPIKGGHLYPNVRGPFTHPSMYRQVWIDCLFVSISNRRKSREVKQTDELVYRVTNGDGSGYNRKNGVQLNTKSKVEGAITNEEYRSPEAKTST